MRWERVPILGSNPVFCYEARRLWTRRTLLVLFLVTLAIAVVAPALGLVSRYVLRHPPGPMFLRFGSRLALVAFPPRVHAVELVLGEVILFTPHAPYVLMSGLDWLAVLGGRYFLPALAALWVASDRASGRLGRLLASGMRPRQIMLGKLLALVAPPCTLMLCGTAVLGPMLIKEGTHDLPLLLWGLLDTGALLLGSIIGLWVGHMTRKPAVAAGISVLCAGVLLPMCRLSIGGTVALALHDMGAPSGPGGVELVSEPVRIASDSALQALIFAGVWFAAKCALTEGAE